MVKLSSFLVSFGTNHLASVLFFFVLTGLLFDWSREWSATSITPFSFSGASASTCRHSSSSLSNVTDVFLSYTPSKFEVEWLEHVHEYKDRECAVLATSPYRKWVQEWLDVTIPSTLLRDSEGWKAPRDLSPDVFSLFRYRKPSGEVQEIWVEPLGGILRDPREPCKRHSQGDWTPHNADVQSKDFLLFDKSLSKLSHKRVLFFYLGSSKYNFHMPGMSWFYPKYKSEGLRVTDLFAWERTPRPGLEYFDGMPNELAASTHFYNFGVVANVDDVQNPVQVLKTIAHPDDYVIFKLDIDNTPIEEAIVESMLADPLALALIDDFFWEHHVNQIDMNPIWSTTYGLSNSIKDSIVYLRKFRDKGVRAHSWP